MYDRQTGRLGSVSFGDYAMPSAHFMLAMESALEEILSTTNPLGVKGIGEAGTIGAPPTLMLLEIERLCRAISHQDLAIQWDVAHEMITFDGRWQAPYAMWRPFADMGSVFAGNIARVSAALPRDVELGVHLCYGDCDGQHFIEPIDASKLVEFSRLIREGRQHPLNWLHMPVPKDRDDAAYFEPLQDLRLGRETELYWA